MIPVHEAQEGVGQEWGWRKKNGRSKDQASRENRLINSHNPPRSRDSGSGPLQSLSEGTMPCLRRRLASFNAYCARGPEELHALPRAIVAWRSMDQAGRADMTKLTKNVLPAPSEATVPKPLAWKQRYNEAALSVRDLSPKSPLAKYAGNPSLDLAPV